MTTVYTLLLSLFVAAIPIIWLDRYFTRQSLRSWLGLSHTITSWGRLFNIFEHRFAYKRKDVQLNLVQAGIYNPRLVVIYFPAKTGLAIILISVIFFLGSSFGLDDSTHRIVAAVVALIITIIAPDAWLQARQKKRIRRVSSQLPYVIDLMAVCVQTGMTIEATIDYLGEELKSFDKDLAFIMRRVSSIAKVSSMQKAFDELLVHFPTRQMRSFVYTLSQSMQYGSSIFDVLTSLSANIREIEMLELEEKVGSLSAKMSVPLVLFIMFPIVILISAPSVMRMMTHV